MNIREFGENNLITIITLEPRPVMTKRLRDAGEDRSR